MTRRKAEVDKARAWHGDVAAQNRLDEDRQWVVWGRGPREVDILSKAHTGDDIAEAIVRGRDEDWFSSDDPLRWVVVLRADEDDVDAWVMEDPSAAGYAPYLITPMEERPAELVQAETERGEVPPQPRRTKRQESSPPEGEATREPSREVEEARERTMSPLDLLKIPAALAGAVVSRVRDVRLLFSDGAVYEGELKVFAGSDLPNIPLFSDSEPKPVVARLSRGLGLPEPLPDVLGLWLKVKMDEGDQDLFLVSSAPTPPGRRFALPATGFFARTYSSLVAYRAGGSRVLIGAIPDDSVREPGVGFEETDAAAADGTLRFRIVVASPVRPWRTAGILYLKERVDGEPDFGHSHAAGGIRPSRILGRLTQVAEKVLTR